MIRVICLFVVFLGCWVSTALAFFTYDTSPAPVPEPPVPAHLEMVPFSKGLPSESKSPEADLQENALLTSAASQSDSQIRSDPISHVGVGVFVAVRSKGAGLPFRTAMPLILPAGWATTFDDPVLSLRLVTWTDGVSWGEALRQICREVGATAEIRWNERRVRIQAIQYSSTAVPLGLAPISSQPMQQPSPEVSEALNDLATEPSSAPVASLGVNVQPEPVSPEWFIEPGSLKGQLEDWAAAAGYQVVWHSRNDWQVQARATLTGSFEDVVKAVVESLHRGGAPLRACIYTGNRVVEIRED